MLKWSKGVCWLLLSCLLLACSNERNRWERELARAAETAETKLAQLRTSLDNKSLRNALLLEQYAAIVTELKPDLAPLINTLAQDGRPEGLLFQELQTRLETAKRQSASVLDQGQAQVGALIEELESVAQASSPVLFGMMLTDPINVLADMSEGKLARVEAMSKNASLQANGAANYGAGSQLVGNPRYGSWQQDSSGNSIWQWLGMYALFSSFAPRPIYYGGWASSRPYSYYHDYGRDYYTSPRQRRQQNRLQQNTQSKFKQQGKRFNSPYARKRTGGVTTAAITQRAATSNRFNSPFAKRTPTPSGSSSSRFSSSSRNASYQRSRSFGGGK